MGADWRQRLDEPEVASRLAGLLDRLDRIEALVDAFGTFATRLPQLADMLGDGTARVQSEARRLDLDPLERGPEWLELSSRALSRDQTARLTRILDLAPKLDRLLEVASRIDPDDVAVLISQIPRAAALLRRPETQRLLEALDADALSLAERVVGAARQVPADAVGPWGALRALGEAPVRRSLGFAIGVARRFGASLSG
jgi:uncharacterized protein YjgD (DUF1641 family)